MKMNFLGVGNYHLIKNPGDFAYRTDVINGIRETKLVTHCPKYQICYIRIHQDEHKDVNGVRTWKWDGNEAEPTITPSIGCDHLCGQHKSIIKGEAV